MSDHEWEAEIARRSAEKAEREQAEADAKAAAEAEAKAQAAADRAALNDAIRTGAGVRHTDLGERIFPTPPEREPSAKPEGSANAGEGEDGAVYEDGMHGRTRVWSLDELQPDNPKETR